MTAEPASPEMKNTYTDAPELHPNLLLGSLQLIFWLFFHPSAWRNHAARIAPGLRPDFCLAELSGAQWRDSALWRLLVQGYGVLPLLVSLLIGLVLKLQGISSEDIVHSIALGVVGGLTYGVAVVVAFGVASGVVVNIVVSIAFGLAGGAAVNAAGGVAISAASGIVYGVTASIANPKCNHPISQWINGIAIGVLIASLAVGIAVGVAHIVAVEVAGSIALGVAFGVTGGWRTHNWRRGLATGVVVGVVCGLAFAIGGKAANDRASSIQFAALFSPLYILPFTIAGYLAGPWAGAAACAMSGGAGSIVMFVILGKASLSTLPIGVMSAFLGLTISWWLPIVSYPFLIMWNLLLFRADEQRVDDDHPSLLHFHSAFWDEHQRLPLLGLEDHLVLAMERNPVEGRLALEYVAKSCQRWAAQKTQIELDARRLKRCADVTSISKLGVTNAHHNLAAKETPGPHPCPGPANALLHRFGQISQDIDAALQQESSYNQRLALGAVESRLDNLVRELTRSGERYAARFRPISTLWRQAVAGRMRELTIEAESRQEIDNPYIVGVPLTERQEIFIGRSDVSVRIEELLLDQRRSPLFLYGQRRMGKTSLLNNLGRLLPSTIVPLYVDLQGPASTDSDHAGLLYNVARCMVNSAERQRGLIIPPLTREALAADPFTCFDEWLDEVEQSLGQRVALLALDEFEALDSAIAKGRFDEEAVLSTLRHLIQHHPRFKVLLSGSHTLKKVQRWTSYLVNVQMVHIGYLKQADAHRLIEQPVREFPLRYEPNASQRVLDLTRGHPFLVQLLCTEIVALKNRQPSPVRRLACLSDVETAVPQALIHGCLFFVNIERNRVDATGLNVLHFLAAQGEGAMTNREALIRQFPNENKLKHALDLLVRRELIELTDGGYRFQVELVRCWFAQGLD